VTARVFVSSVIEEFADYREAARRAIVQAGGEPVLVNEDFPSFAASSRNVCLDAVDSSDVLLCIIGSRGGWTAPSGKLVVEEEYERAVDRKLPVIVFLEVGSRDADAERLAKRLSDYVDGSFRRTFATARELESEISRALHPLLDSPLTRAHVTRSSRDHFARPYAVQGTTMLRFVLVPERDEEVIDPIRLGSEEFRRRLFEIGHAPIVRLLSYERPKSTSLEGDDLVILQTTPIGRHGEGEEVRIQLSESGELVLDANVTDRARRGGDTPSMGHMVVAVEDIESVLEMFFAFSSAIFDELDRFKRQQRFSYNVALSGLGFRSIERNPKARSSYAMSMRNTDTIVAFEQSRVVTRSDIAKPNSEIARAVELLTRRAAASR
jgi:hypothetical protein